MRLPPSRASLLVHRPRLRQPPTPRLPASPFKHSYSTILTPQTSQVRVPLGANGDILLDIHPPHSPSPATPILIYLPRGHLPLSLPPPPPPPLTALALSANLTLVALHYRLSATHPYPGPIHDVLAGYDWVLQHLVHGAAAHNAWQSAARPCHVAVCGELLGGSLAAMLALTECQRGKAGAVRAAVLGSAVVDWTAMYPLPDNGGAGEVDGSVVEGSRPPKRRIAKARISRADSWRSHASNAQLSTTALLAARNALFAKPEHYHDPFASPLLFFRTASSDLPVSDPSLLSSLLKAADPSSDLAPTNVVAFLKTRRAYRRHPPLGSGLVLPRTRIDVGAESVLRDQGVEFAEGMRRSGGRERRRKGEGEEAWSGGETGGDVDAGEKIELREMGGGGLWGEEDMVGVGRWVVEALKGVKGAGNV